MKILHVENSSGRGGSLKSLKSLWPPPSPWKSVLLSLERSWAPEVSVNVPTFNLPKQSVWAAWRFLQNQKIDLVHLNNSPIEAWSCLVAAWLEGIPVVSHFRSNRLFRKLEILLNRMLDTIWVLSESHKKRLPRTPQIKVLRNAVEPIDYSSPPQKAIVGVFSVLKKDKGHESLLRAMSQIKRPWHLKVVGGEVTDQSTTLPELKALARELEIEEKIEFTGHVSNPIEMMRTCSLIVDPSKKAEGFRRTVTEAALLGRPILATDVGGVRDLLPSQWLLDPRDMTKWPHLIEKHLQHINADEVKSLRLKAQKLFDVKKNYQSFWAEVSRLKGLPYET